MIPFICGIKKKLYKGTYLQNRNKLADTENKFVVTKGERRRRNKLRVWDLHIDTTICKRDNQQEPTVQHRKLTQYLAIT